MCLVVDEEITEVTSVPNIKSAIKRVRVAEKANAQNVSQVSAMRSAVKKFEAAKAEGKDTAALYTAAVRAVDMAESKGLIHANKAARDKSRLARVQAK